MDGSKGEIFPLWTTTQRPTSTSAGQTGFNTSNSGLETYTSGWTTNYNTLPNPSYFTSAEVTINIATSYFFTGSSNALPNNALVTFSTTGALPTGITAATNYYVVNSNGSGDFQVSDTINGTAITLSGTQSGTHTATPVVSSNANNILLSTDGSTWTSYPRFTTFTQTLASSASVSFTNIPYWVRRVIISFNTIISASFTIQVQLGSGGIQTTGYLSGSSSIGNGPAGGGINSTTYFAMRSAGGAGNSSFGSMTINYLDANTWVSTHTLSTNVGSTDISGAGVVTLGGTLDQILITTSSGNFTSGTISITYE